MLWVVPVLSAEPTDTPADRREPRFLKGTLSAVDNEERLFVPILLALAVLDDFTPLDCFNERIFFSEYAKKFYNIINGRQNINDE